MSTEQKERVSLVSDEQIATIARGEQPAWEGTYEHPRHGEITFTVPRMPLVADWLAHENAQNHISPGNPTYLSAAVAAMRTFLEVPVVDRQVHDDPDNPDHEKVTLIRYDPMSDDDPGFPIRVWLEFMAWKEELLSDQTKERVKNASGVTSGDAESASLPATTDSPLPTSA